MTSLDERATPPPARTDINADLGFGSVVALESRRRLPTATGRLTSGVRELTISWMRFFSFSWSGRISSWQVTAFTLAHTITLALTIYGVVDATHDAGEILDLIDGYV